MEPHQLIILIVTVVSLLGGIAWLMIANLRKRWPKGRRYETIHEGAGVDMPYLVHVIFAPGVKNRGRARYNAAKAVWAAGAAWNIVRNEGRVAKDDSELREVIVLFVLGEHMDAKAQAWGYNSIAGYIDRWSTRKWGGDRLPMAVVSARNMDELNRQGEPVIHEMLHALERDYVGGADDHSNPRVWAATAKQENIESYAVQEKAREIFASQQHPGEVV